MSVDKEESKIRKLLKQILRVIGIIFQRYLDVIGLCFLSVNMLLFYIDHEFVTDFSIEVYSFGITLVMIAIIVNLVQMDLLKSLSGTAFLLLIFGMILVNSDDIVMNFSGIVVDMGDRSRELALVAFPGFLLILLVFRKISKPAFAIAMGITALIALAYAGIAIYGFATKTTEMWGFTLVLGERYQSVLNNANALGELSFLGLLAVAYLIVTLKPISIRIVLAVLCLGLVLAIVLSGSRTSFIMALVLLFVLYAYFRYQDPSLKILLVVALFVILGLSAYLLFGGFPELVELLRDDLHLSGRDQIWQNLMTIIRDEGFRGIGYDNLTYVYNERFHVLTSAHNLYLGLFVETGLIGMILAILWLLSQIIWSHNRIILNPNHTDRKYLIITNAFLIAFLVGQMFEYAFLKISTHNTFVLAFLGFALNAGAGMAPKTERFNPLEPTLLIVLLGTGIWGLWRNLDHGIIAFALIIVALLFIGARGICQIDYASIIKRQPARK